MHLHAILCSNEFIFSGFEAKQMVNSLPSV